MPDVLRAVGSRSFTYELLPNDDLTRTPQSRATFVQDSQARLQAMGIDPAQGLQQFGGESIFPKIGYAMTELIGAFGGTGNVAPLMSTGAGYVGQPVQRYFKIAWAYAGETRPTLMKRTLGKGIDRATRANVNAHLTLSNTRRGSAGRLAGFVNGLVANGFLGDSIVGWEQQQGFTQAQSDTFRTELELFARSVVTAMRARTRIDRTLSAAQQQNVAAAPTDAEAFGRARNLHFLESTRAAVGRGVRYIGMGDNHRLYLIQNGVHNWPGVNHYNLKQEPGLINDMADFQDVTRHLLMTRNPLW